MDFHAMADQIYPDHLAMTSAVDGRPMRPDSEGIASLGNGFVLGCVEISF
jgi:hypothetical protein